MQVRVPAIAIFFYDTKTGHAARFCVLTLKVYQLR